MNYGKFMAKISDRRKPSLIRLMTETYMKNRKSALFFAGGMPNAKLFPIDEISVTYKGGTRMLLEGSDLFPALQYGPSRGYAPFVQRLREFQKTWHSPKYEGWDVQVTAGSMEGCSKVFELLLDEGDPVMAQSPTYTGVLNAIMPLRPDFIEIGMDEDGVLASEIARVCEERLKSGKPMPKLLYVNPTGANPVGIVYSTARKREIYELARKYDFLIVEDDAYYFVHFLEEQPVSFLSLDVDGRVLRLDSFSKIMSAGLRLGVLTGPKPLLEKIVLHVETSTMHSSSLSQVLVHNLLSSWSDDQLGEHFRSVARFYREQRDVMLKAVEKYFEGIAEWSVPQGGMFFWIKIKDLDDVMDLTINKCMPRGVFAMPGHPFYANSKASCNYLRLCYSLATPDEIDEGLCKISTIVREAIANKKKNRK